MPIIVIILIIGAIALGVSYFSPSKQTGDNTEQIVENTADDHTATHANHIISGTGHYTTPANQPLHLTVSVAVNDQDLIEEVSVIYDDQEAGKYTTPFQERFDNAYHEAVIGQDIKTVSLSRVGGASLTSDAFNEAIQNILTTRSTEVKSESETNPKDQSTEEVSTPEATS